MKERWTKLKSNPIGQIVWLAAICGCFILLLSSPYRETYTIRERVLWAILAIVSTLIGHELVHALTASILCRCKVRIQTRKDPMGLPSLCTLFPQNISAGKKIVIYIAPLVVLTVIPVIILLTLKPVLFLFFMAMAICAGVYYDLLDILIILSSKRKL